jgi:hypothetical protein
MGVSLPSVGIARFDRGARFGLHMQDFIRAIFLMPRAILSRIDRAGYRSGAAFGGMIGSSR